MSVCLYVTFYNPSKVTASPSTFIFGRAQTSPIRSNVCLYVCHTFWGQNRLKFLGRGSRPL